MEKNVLTKIKLEEKGFWGAYGSRGLEPITVGRVWQQSEEEAWQQVKEVTFLYT